MRASIMRFVWIAILAVLVAVGLLLRRNSSSASSLKIAGRTHSTVNAPDLQQTDRVSAGETNTTTRTDDRNDAYPEDIQRALDRSRENAAKLEARFPGTKEKLLARHRIDAALKLSEFLSHAGIVGEERDRLLDLLAEEMEAPSRGELGEREVQEMRQLIGDEKYEQMRAFEKISPGLHQADEIVARLRDAKVQLGESEAGIRELTANTAMATEEIRRRIYQGTPIDGVEERLLVERARARFETLRSALSAAGDERALQVLDAWIAQKIAADLKFAKEALAWHEKRKH